MGPGGCFRSILHQKKAKGGKRIRIRQMRKTLNHLKCVEKFQGLGSGPFVREEVTSTLCYLYEWSRFQSEITARQNRMVTEAWMRQKKLENQLKFEAKLHELEVEWCGGPGTPDEILAKLCQREEAASKLDRAMAFFLSFSTRNDVTNFDVESRLRLLPWPDFLLSSQRLGLELDGALAGCTAMGNS